MIAIALITFRETLEMLLVGSIILLSLHQLRIYKKYDFIVGAGTGLILSSILFAISSFAGSKIHFNISSETSELFEGINYLGSGIFLFITAILLHNKMKSFILGTPSLLLDTSLFAVGFLTVFREGMEIVMFSISSTVTSSFYSSLMGFVVGITGTVLVGLVGRRITTSYLTHKKLLTGMDWGIKILSLYFIAKGVVALSEYVL